MELVLAKVLDNPQPSTTGFATVDFDRGGDQNLPDPAAARAYNHLNGMIISSASTTSLSGSRSVSWTPKMRQVAKAEPCP